MKTRKEFFQVARRRSVSHGNPPLARLSPNRSAGGGERDQDHNTLGGDAANSGNSADVKRKLMFERTLTFWFGDLYSLSEVKRILKAFDQFADLYPEGGKEIRRAKRQQFMEEICVAAYRLQGDVEARVHVMLTDREAIGNKTISDQLRALDDPFYEPPEERIVPTRRNYLHRYWQVLGAIRTPRWRKNLKRLQTGKICLRKALRSSPLIRYALREGLMLSNLVDDLGSRWLHRLECSPELLARVTKAALSDKYIAEKRGRPAHPELKIFVTAAISAAETIGGKHVSATDHKDRRSKSDGISRRTSPGLKLVYACVKPLYLPATLESCGGLIRKSRSQR